MRINALVTVLVISLLLISVVAVPVAADTRAGGTVTVGADETVGSLTVFGGTVIIDGTVDGDLEVFAGTVLINGEVTGSVAGIGGSVQITGSVGEAVEIAAGSIRLAEGATVGSIAAGAGSVTIDGTVTGDVRLGAGSITLGETAVIEGDLTYGGDLSMADGAQVQGTITEERIFGLGTFLGVGILDWVGTVFFFVMHLALGVLLLLIAPRFSRSLAASVRTDPIRSGAVGLATIVLVPILLVAITITIIGIPIAFAGALLFLVLYWVGLVYGRYAIGEWLLAYTEVDNRWLALVLGLALVGLISLIPWIGSLVSFIVTLLGLGALVHLLISRRDREQAAETGPTAS